MADGTGRPLRTIWTARLRGNRPQPHSHDPQNRRSIACGGVLRLVVLGIATLLASCGSPSSPAAAPPAPQGTPTKATQPAIPFSPAQTLKYDQDGVYVETSVTCDQFTVLASPRLTYDVGDIRLMESYYSAVLV